MIIWYSIKKYKNWIVLTEFGKMDSKFRLGITKNIRQIWIWTCCMFNLVNIGIPFCQPVGQWPYRFEIFLFFISKVFSEDMRFQKKYGKLPKTVWINVKDAQYRFWFWILILIRFWQSQNRSLLEWIFNLHFNLYICQTYPRPE